MSQVTTTTTTGNVPAGGFVCRTGRIARAEQVGIIQRGSHRLFELSTGRIVALSSTQVNLNALEGGIFTVCGISEGMIEGVLSLRVTQVVPLSTQPVIPPLVFPPFAQPQIDPRLLLLILLLTNPSLLQVSPQTLLLSLLLGGGSQLFGRTPGSISI